MTISDVTVQNNALAGVYVDNSGDVAISNSSITDNLDRGIHLVTNGHVTIDDVVLERNGGTNLPGFALWSAASVKITDSSSTGSGTHGFAIQQVLGTTELRNVMATQNLSRGLFLNNAETSVAPFNGGHVSLIGGAYNSNSLGGISLGETGDVAIRSTTARDNGPQASSGGGLRILSTKNIGVTIDGVTIARNTSVQQGGGVFIQMRGEATHPGKSLQIRDSVIEGNRSTSLTLGLGGGGLQLTSPTGQPPMNAVIERTSVVGNRASQHGGGLYSNVLMTIKGSTFASNHSDLDGGGVHLLNTTTITNSTFSGNTATNNGGGLNVKGNLTLSHSTIAANMANAGSGLAFAPASTGPSARVGNTLIADNSINPYIGEVSGNVTSQGYNFVESAGPNSGFFAPGDSYGSVNQPLDAKLGPLADNGGPTRTHAPQANSPVIDRGNPNSTLTVDQRGRSRPVDANLDGIVRIDIGAVEVLSINDDSYQTDEDQVLRVAAPGVLANDNTLAGNSATATVIDRPAHGVVNLQSDGSFVYTPNSNYHGPDSFTYQRENRVGATNTATVFLTIHSVNDPPVASNDAAATDEDSPVLVNVLANDTDADGDPLTVSLAAGPSHGTASVHNDGSIQYTPAPNYHGPDSFTYTITDPSGASSTATVNVTIHPVNDAPFAGNDRATTDEDTPVTVDVLANDVDLDGDALTVTIASGPANGTTSVQNDGSIRYTPAPNYHGSDRFTYTITDPSGASSTATVNVTIHSVNDPPTAVDAVFELLENSSTGTTVGQISAWDVDGDTLHFSLSGAEAAPFAIDPQSGVISVVDAALLDYETNREFEFTVEVRDGNGGLDTANVRVALIDVRELAIDIVPGDEQNRIHIKSKYVEVAILGSATFDPSKELDFGSLRLRTPESSGGAKVPYSNRRGYEFEKRDVNGDGILDVVIAFRRSQTGLKLSSKSLVLDGTLKPQYGGAAFSIHQAITVVTNGNGNSRRGGGDDDDE